MPLPVREAGPRDRAMAELPVPWEAAPDGGVPTAFITEGHLAADALQGHPRFTRPSFLSVSPSRIGAPCSIAGQLM